MQKISTCFLLTNCYENISVLQWQGDHHCNFKNFKLFFISVFFTFMFQVEYIKILSHNHKQKNIYDTHLYSFHFTISIISFSARLEGLQQRQTTMATDLTGILINLFIHKMVRCREIMVTQVNIFGYNFYAENIVLEARQGYFPS